MVDDDGPAVTDHVTDNDLVDILRDPENLLVYLNNTVHQIKTPLTVIKTYSELILAEVYGPVSGEMNEKVSTIGANLEEISNFIDQVHDVSLIASDDLKPSREPYDITLLAESACSDMHEQARPKGLRFELEDMESSMMLDIDPHLSRRAILNVLRYVTYSSPKGATVKVALKLAKEKLLLVIMGYGEAMTDEQMNSSVKMMARKKASVTTVDWEKLSMPIARIMMLVQGGDLTVLEEEHGTTIHILEFPVPNETGKD